MLLIFLIYFQNSISYFYIYETKKTFSSGQSNTQKIRYISTPGNTMCPPRNPPKLPYEGLVPGRCPVHLPRFSYFYKMRYPILFLWILLFPYLLKSQEDSLSDLFFIHRDHYNIQSIDRLDILYDDISVYSSFQPLDTRFLNAGFAGLRPEEQRDLDRIRMDFQWSRKSKKSVLRHFYSHPSYLYAVNEARFKLGINPVLYLEAGREQGRDGIPYINSRGLEMRGLIGKKISFYSFVTDNQAGFRSYINEYADSNWGIIPHENNAKTFRDGLLFKDARDFFSARGYITFRPVPEVLIMFGQDRNFIGNGYRSLLLSDWSKDYMQLKIQTEVWKIKYSNLFAQLVDFRDKIADNLQPRKFLAAHYLDIALGPGLQLGLFEAVVFGNTDSTQRSFDPYYLNPIIFYRSVEYALGSSDNIFIGANLKYNFLQHFQFYSQILFDEFRFYKLFQNDGWWANKYALQLGLKYINSFGVRGLDLQGELNRVRPYTYTHVSNAGSYTQFGQALAHPLGANFNEWIGIVHFRPLDELSFYGRIIYAVKGTDSTGSNFGGDIFASYETRPFEYGNYTGQGVRSTLLNTELTLSYRIRQNAFLELSYNYRKLNSAIDSRDRQTSYLALRFRLNAALKDWGF